MRKTVFLLAGSFLLNFCNLHYARAGDSYGYKIAAGQADTGIGGKGDRAQAQKAEYYLGLGWKYLESNELEKAMENFAIASVYPEAAREAKLGKGFCYLRKNAKEAALKVFRELARLGFRDKDVLPPLIGLLHEKGELEEARKYLARLDDKTSDYWTLRLNMEGFNGKVQSVIQNGGVDSSLTLIKEHNEEYRRCIAPEGFLKIANFLVEQGRAEKAGPIYKDLLEFCRDNDDARLAIIEELQDSLDHSEINDMLGKEVSAGGKGKYKARLEELKLGFLRKLLAATTSSEPSANELANEILRINPEDEFALATLAWWHYHKEQYPKALSYFAKLSRMRPENESYAQGLTYTQIKLNSPDGISIDEAMGEDAARELAGIRKDLFFNKMAESFGRRKYGDIERYLKKLTRIQPENREYEILLAWILYYSFKEKEALPIFLKLYKKGENLALAEVIHELYKEIGITRDEADLLEVITDTDEGGGKNISTRQSLLDSVR